jgi:hypothetical protein
MLLLAALNLVECIGETASENHTTKRRLIGGVARYCWGIEPDKATADLKVNEAFEPSRTFGRSRPAMREFICRAPATECRAVRHAGVGANDLLAQWR